MLDKKIFLIAVVLMTGLLPIKDYAQSYDANSTPMSGNATAADKFASIPVNLYTGVAPVSVPLYSYSTQSGLHTGFSLNYFLGGIQANESGTPVGMGWFLEGGGIITRTVRGMPDDMGANGYIYSNSASIFSIPNQSKLYYDTMDAEQDVFQFNFNGRSGKFFIGKNKQIIIGSLTKLNIQYSTAADSSISSFTVIEEDGAKYVFDQIESQSITAGFACGYNSKTYNTGWQL